MITNRFFNIPAFTVSTGVLICLVAVLGFYGALSQSFYVIAAVSRDYIKITKEVSVFCCHYGGFIIEMKLLSI